LQTPKPWQIGNIPGQLQANVLTPEVAANMIKRANRKLLVIGPKSIGVKINDKEDLIDFAVKLSKIGVHIVATANTSKEFVARGFTDVYPMGIVEITNRLRDAEWKGLDGKGSYDLIIFLGGIYYLESQVLANTKHFALTTKTLTFDRFYHPNADWSFPNLEENEWCKSLNIILSKIGGV
jgi:acetyl-CoA decarbonylase/synthase complex subunit epsilon